MKAFIRDISLKNPRRKIRGLLQETSGYTLFELIVALQLAFIIIGMIYLAYGLFQQQMERWQAKINREAAFSQFSHVLTLTFDPAEKILLATPDKFIAQSAEGDSITIELRDNIYINQRPLLEAGWISLEKGHFSFYDKNLSEKEFFPGQAITPDKFDQIRALTVNLQLSTQIGSFQEKLFFQLPANR